MGAHAKKSASGAKRWMNCPGSIELTDRLPRSHVRKSGEAARLGTAAHGLGEYCLSSGLRTSRGLIGGFVCLDREEDATVLLPKSHSSGSLDHQRVELQIEWPHVYEIDDDMASAVDVYLDTVWGVYDGLPGSELMVEKRFDLTWLRPDMFGTGDASVFEFLGRLYVIDYKHGAGVTVEVKDRDGKPNVQLMYYGLGLAEEVDWLFEDLELVIVQPRKEHEDGPVRSVVVTKHELREYMRELAAASDMVEEARKDPERHLEAGEWCGFCPVAPTCPLLVRIAQDTCQMDFADDPFDLEAPDVDDAERLARILEWKPKIDAFLRASDALAQRLLEQGFGEGLRQKLVRKRAYRKYTVSEEVVVGRLTALGLAREQLYSAPKLKGPAQTEKLGPAAKKLIQGVKNKDYDREDPLSPYWLQEPLAAKGEGGLTMAHESDPREAVAVDAASDFDDDLELEEGED